jgi:hypothetical protein
MMIGFAGFAFSSLAVRLLNAFQPFDNATTDLTLSFGYFAE